MDFTGRREKPVFGGKIIMKVKKIMIKKKKYDKKKYAINKN